MCMTSQRLLLMEDGQSSPLLPDPLDLHGRVCEWSRNRCIFVTRRGSQPCSFLSKSSTLTHRLSLTPIIVHEAIGKTTSKLSHPAVQLQLGVTLTGAVVSVGVYK